jgi:hypothetical protein
MNKKNPVPLARKKPQEYVGENVQSRVGDKRLIRGKSPQEYDGKNAQPRVGDKRIKPIAPIV